MSIRLVLYTLSAALAVWGHPHLEGRATPAVYDACINANEIALTFDDGPYIHLRSISDQFTAAGAKATFFFNGNNFDCIYNPDRIGDIKYAYAAGHMIGSHTWSHADLTTLSTDQIKDGMFRMEEALSRILGVRPAFMRPPFGSTNSNVQSVAFGRGQSLALWDTDTEDADGATVAFSEGVYNQVATSKPKNALILEHETLATTANTLVPFALNLFKSKGYNLVTMAQCLGVDPYQATGVPQTPTATWTCDGTPDPGEACGGSIACETGTPPLSTTTTTGPSGPTSTTTTTTTTGPSGPTSTATFIHPTANAAKCLSVASNTDGAAVEIEDCVAGGSTSQGWTISGSNLKIFGTKCLDVSNGATADGTKLQIWTCAAGNTNQMWTLFGEHDSVEWAFQLLGSHGRERDEQ
ncbi:hypothetical protein B0H14DRAFT_1541548 [Mycena olivaceomarginata]|nr:hypothetical protein B0H14DRAFT_1541548 [Mycena olivaceomarginata]